MSAYVISRWDLAGEILLCFSHLLTNNTTRTLPCSRCLIGSCPWL